MKKPNLNCLIQAQKNNQLLKEQANELANQLIVEFDINEGYQMADFLKVSHGLDNYTAIRLWSEKWLKKYFPLSDNAVNLENLQQDDSIYRTLKKQFFSHFPDTAVA